MSAVNVFVTRDGSLGHMITDSLASELGGQQLPACQFLKHVPIPHARTVVAVRGHSTLIFIALGVAAKGNNFDELAAEWGQVSKTASGLAAPVVFRGR